jgi:SOS response regulatory protein OraA/RecX
VRQLRTTTQDVERDTFRRKVMDYLLRRGFDYEVAREAADRHWKELDE